MSLPHDPGDLTVFVAGIGFIGGLAGAFIGFVGNYVTTSRQIARQERNVRREAYLETLHFLDHLFEILRRVREWGDERENVRSEAVAEVERIVDRAVQDPEATAATVEQEVNALVQRMTDVADAPPRVTMAEVDAAVLQARQGISRLQLVAANSVLIRSRALFSAIIDKDHIDSQDAEVKAARKAFIAAARADVKSPSLHSTQAVDSLEDRESTSTA